MKKLLLIKPGNEKADQVSGDIVGIFPVDHDFSFIELLKFDVVQVSDEKVESLIEEISNYKKQNTDIEVIIKQKYIDGNLTWQIV
jgi:hypothetical protein